MEEEPAPFEEQEFERRLLDALSNRADRASTSPYAYRSVLRTTDRRRRRRHRRRMIAGSAVAVSAMAVPIGVSLLDADGPTEVRSPEFTAEGTTPLPAGVAPAEAPSNTAVDLSGPATASDYVQVFRAEGRDGRLVARQSSLPPDRLVPPDDSTDVEINGAKAWLVRQDSRRASLTWADDQSLVVRQLHARSFSDAELIDVARTLQRRASGLGFDTSSLPDGLDVVSEGGLDDEPAESTEVRFEVGGGALNVAFRNGSPLELELIRATASEILDVTIDGVDRVLTTESVDDGDTGLRHTLSWMLQPDVIVDVSGDGVARNELIAFVNERDLLSIYDAAGDAAVVVRPDETQQPDGPADDVRLGVAVEGVISGTSWRVSLNDTGRRCVVLQVGATEAEECLSGGVEVFTFDGGDRTALVIVGDGEAITAVTVADALWLADGRAGDLWVGWLPDEAIGSPVTVTTAAGDTNEIPLGSAEDSSGQAS